MDEATGINLAGMGVRLKADPPAGSRLAMEGLRAGASGRIEDISAAGVRVRFEGCKLALWVSAERLEIALDAATRELFARIAKAAGA